MLCHGHQAGTPRPLQMTSVVPWCLFLFPYLNLHTLPSLPLQPGSQCQQMTSEMVEGCGDALGPACPAAASLRSLQPCPPRGAEPSLVALCTKLPYPLPHGSPSTPAQALSFAALGLKLPAPDSDPSSVLRPF